MKKGSGGGKDLLFLCLYQEAVHKAALQCQHRALAVAGASGEQQGESCSEQSHGRAAPVTALAQQSETGRWDRTLLSSCDIVQSKVVN